VTTTALAIAEVTVRRGCPVRLLDTTDPAWSALAAATDTELDTRAGWRRGRRTVPGAAPLTIDRLAISAATPERVPPPRADAPAPGLTILDVGWTARELDAHPGGWIGALRNGHHIVAPVTTALVLCRATPQAIRQLDRALQPFTTLDPVVGLIGPGRPGARLLAEAGPLLRAAWTRDAVVALPTLRRTPDLATAPLPRPLTLATERLMARLLPLTGQLPTDPHRKETP
jgi:hypothetical protein